MDPDPLPSIAPAIAALHARIADAARRAGRNPESVTLVAVSKTHPRNAVEAALACGQTVFGENRVQEAAEKFSALRQAHPALRLHLIGGLQTNKAEQAVRLADVIESLDRPRLADAIATAADRAGRLPELLVQINIGEEPQKSGVLPIQADAFIRACRARFGDAVQGIMAVPPAAQDPAPYFQALAEIRAAHGLKYLSMGMSGDFETAIAHGATHIRIGSAIFGHRA